ncbi:histidine kinase [Dactylosporangium sp. NPDC049140]|uniref:sensor histidine kinase n=1 Tax=Dactylosporangium sp. NPDC049140 TaxID=3155647 RepID=UPI0033D4868F
MNWVVRVPRAALARDGALAVVLAVVGMITAGEPVPALLAVGAALPLAARRVWPLPVACITATATAAYLVWGYRYGFILVSFAVAVYTAALLLPPRRAVFVGTFALAALLAHVIALGGRSGLGGLLPGSTWAVLPFAAGWSVRIGRESAALRREEQARLWAYEERLRVAQEVHDVVGHGLAAITMQADIALHMLPSRPEQAPIALAAIRSAGRAALDELRATLSMVREEPTPGVAGLADLVERMSGTGLEVALAVADTVRALPEAVDRTVYRIVQEALTNVLRHAGATRVDVDVAYGRDVIVTVRDDGRHAPVYVPGRGIAGMAARAEALGGTVEAGPDPEGGFRVCARLPVPAVSA